VTQARALGSKLKNHGKSLAASKGSLLLGGLFVLLNLPGLSRSPVVWNDEVVLCDPGRELAVHGTLRSSVFADFPGFERRYMWLPPGQALVAAASYKLFGFGLWQTRIPGLLFGAAALAMIYLLALRLFGDPLAAWFGAAILGLYPAFIQTARAARNDTGCLFFVLLATVFYLEAHWKPCRAYLWYGASSLSLGLAGMFHPIATVWAAALGLLVLLLGGKGRVWKVGWLALCASLLPLIWFGWALSTPDLFRMQFLSHGMAHLAKGTIPQRLDSELYIDARSHLRLPMLLAAYAAGAIWVLFFAHPRRDVKVILVILFSVPFLLISAVMMKGQGAWLLYPASVLALCAGLTLARLWRARIARAPGWAGLLSMGLVALVFANLFAVGLGGRWLMLAWQYRERDYGQVEAPIKALIPRGSIVLGPPQAWYALMDAGATLRLQCVNFDPSYRLAQPNPWLHDFVIRESSRSSCAFLAQESPKPLREDLSGFHQVQRIGTPLRPLFGRFRVSESADYQLEIWKSDLR
jgi:4-amino-4-deoxy-L-arabinose transferase-like glycosyltransferase